MQIPYLVVRYEDLCTNPVETMKKICSFVDLPFNNLDLTRLDKSQSHTIFGNPMRTDAHKRQKLVYDDRWHEDKNLQFWYKLLLPVKWANERSANNATQ